MEGEERKKEQMKEGKRRQRERDKTEEEKGRKEGLTPADKRMPALTLPYIMSRKTFGEPAENFFPCAVSFVLQHKPQ